jgi:drug/metabolite transporter (DMT)-like permease
VFQGKKMLGLVLAFIATAFWASFYIVSRYAFGENDKVIDPVFFTFLRFMFASLFFLMVLGWRGKLGDTTRVFKKNLWIFGFLAIAGIVGEGILVFWSMKYTTAARSSLFANASPIFTVLMAMAVGERLNRRKSLGMVIGFAGAAIAIFSSGGGDMYFSATSILGDLLALGSGVCWAAYTVWGAGVSEKFGSLASTAISIILGTVIIFALVICCGSPMVWSFSWKLWLAIIYLGVCGNGISYLCWFAALKYLKAGEVGAFGYISAALTALLSFTLLGETFTVSFFLAMGGIIFGVYLMMEKPPEKAGNV